MIRGAVVCQVDEIGSHPNGDKLDLVWVSWPYGASRVVTGKHYRKGQMGVYIPAGLTIPGWMAEDMWLFGRARAMRERFEVRAITLQGVSSPGLFCGEIYRKVADDPRSVERYQKLASEGGMSGNEWINWPFWRSWWKLGDDVTAYLGLTERYHVTPTIIDGVHTTEAEVATQFGDGRTHG